MQSINGTESINILEDEKEENEVQREKYMSWTESMRRETESMLWLRNKKQRLKAKTHKLKRYERRIELCILKRLLEQNQKQVYQKLDGKESNQKAVPDVDESKSFRSNIRFQETQHEAEAVGF